ncbi:MAG: DEAD/DEAH box helicase [Planctomycetota bacterium]
MSFENLQLNEKLLQAIAHEGYHTATPIQLEAIPHVLQGRDLWGCAQTGTGKTAAFALPTLHRLLESKAAAIAAAKAQDATAQASPAHASAGPGARGAGHRRGTTQRAIRALVLAPTRELAAQIGTSFQVYGRFCGLRQTVIYGGVGQGRQVQALRDGVDILVATPGRLLDLMNQGYIRLSAVELLILDEADQMLDMGFLPDLKRIVSQVPRQRQTLMFSATMPPEIRELSEQWLRDPVRVQVAAAGTPTARVEQFVYMVEGRDKPRFLAQFLLEQNAGRTLVFTRTKHGADKVVRVLERAGVRAAAIHGNKSQNARARVLAAFKSPKPPVLVATDIAARGLDIDQIAHVVNYDLPNVAETYVHRIGRTGRAGADGTAISLCSGEERGFLRQIERLTRVRLAVRNYTLAPREPDAESSADDRDFDDREDSREDARGDSRSDSRGERSGDRRGGPGRGGPGRGGPGRGGPGRGGPGRGGPGRGGPGHESRGARRGGPRQDQRGGPREERLGEPGAENPRGENPRGEQFRAAPDELRHEPRSERRGEPQGERRGAPSGDRRGAPRGDRPGERRGEGAPRSDWRGPRRGPGGPGRPAARKSSKWSKKPPRRS